MGPTQAWALLLGLARANAACVPPDSFTPLDLTGARVVRSNIGGLGGECTSVGACDEIQTASTPHEMYLRNVARSPSGQQVDLRITNATEYRSNTPELNGLTSLGDMAELNLFGPTSSVATRGVQISQGLISSSPSLKLLLGAPSLSPGRM